MLTQREMHLTVGGVGHNCENRRIENALLKAGKYALLCVGSELRGAERMVGRSRMNREVHVRSL